MERSRIVVYVAVALGLLATFMPWQSAGPFTATGMDGPDGLINIGIFGVPVLLNLVGPRDDPSRLSIGILIAFFGCLGIGLGALHVMQGVDDPQLTTGIGPFLIVLAGAMLLAHRFVKEEKEPVEEERPPQDLAESPVE